MATLSSYVDRMPPFYQQRYQSRYWVAWANALLERLSGGGFLPPQLVTCGVIAHGGVWIDRPIGSRDIKELRNSKNQNYTYRFAEENDKLRLMDVTLPEAKRLDLTVISGNAYGVAVESPELEEDQLKNMLFVATGGRAAGKTFIVSGNEKSDEESGTADVFFLQQSGGNWSAPDREYFSQTVTYDTNVTPLEQNTFYAVDDDGENDYISLGYFVAQDSYFILAYTAAFVPVCSLSDDLGITGYENLIDSWFRWKTEEQASAVSHECVYWQGRVDDEFSQLRAERYNRINKPTGRRLAGFENARRRYA